MEGMQAPQQLLQRIPTPNRYNNSNNNNEPSHDIGLVGQEPGTGPGPGPGLGPGPRTGLKENMQLSPIEKNEVKEKASNKLRLHPLELSNAQSAYSGLGPSDLTSPTKSVSVAGTMTVLSTITPDLKEPALTARKSPPGFAFSSAVSTPSLFAQIGHDEHKHEERGFESRATIPLIPQAQPGTFMANTISPLMMAATAAAAASASASASASTAPPPLMMPPTTVAGIHALPLPAPISPFIDASWAQANERRELSTDPFQHPAQPFQYQNPLRKPRKPYTISKNRENWSEEEHRRFIDALELFGRDWKSIQNHIETKDVQQIRSHAQKYFAKVSKNNSGEYVPPARPKRKCQQPYPKKTPMMTDGGATSTSPTTAKLPEGTAMSDADPLLAPNAHSLYANVSAPSESTTQHFATSSESSHHGTRGNSEREGLLDDEEQRQKLEYLHRMHYESEQHDKSIHEQQRQQAARMLAAGAAHTASSPYGPGIVFPGYDVYGRHPSVLSPAQVVRCDANRQQVHESHGEYRGMESVSAAGHSVGGPAQLAGFVARHHGPASGVMHLPPPPPLPLPLPQTQQQHNVLGDGANGQPSMPSMLAGMLRDSSSSYGFWSSAPQSIEEHQRMREASATIPSTVLPSLYPRDSSANPMMAVMPSMMYPTQTYYYPAGYDQIILNYPGRVMMVTSNPPVSHTSVPSPGNPAWGHMTSLGHFGAVDRTLMRQFSSSGRGSSGDSMPDRAESVVAKNEQSVDVSNAQSCNSDAIEAASCVNQHHRKAAHQPGSLHAQNSNHMHTFPHHSHAAHAQHLQHRSAVAEPVTVHHSPVNDPVVDDSAVRLEASLSLQQNTDSLAKKLSDTNAKSHVNVSGQAPVVSSEVAPKAKTPMDIVAEWKRENSKNAPTLEAGAELAFAAPVSTSPFLESELLSPARDQESSSDSDNPEPPSDSGSDGSGGRRSLGKSVTGKNGSDSGSDEGMEAGASSGTDQPSSNDIEVTVTIPAGTTVDDRRRMAYGNGELCRSGSGYDGLNPLEHRGSKNGAAEAVPVNRNFAGQHFHAGQKRFRENGKDSGSDGGGSGSDSGSGSGGSGSGLGLGLGLGSHGMSMDGPQGEHGHLGGARSQPLRPHAPNVWGAQKGLPESLTNSASRLSSAMIDDAQASDSSSQHNKVDGVNRHQKAHSAVENHDEHAAKVARPSEQQQEAREEMREMFDAVETLQQLAELANVSPKKHQP